MDYNRLTMMTKLVNTDTIKKFLVTNIVFRLPPVKEKILSIVDAEAEQWLGCAMTYTLFECLKEKVPELLAEQTEEAVVTRVEKIVLEDQVS